MPNSSILTIRGLSIRFGGLTAVDRVDLDIERGSITSIIGPNGAGKTTLFNAMSGFVQPNAGDIRIDGHDVQGGRLWRSAVAAFAVGLVTAAAAGCLALNPDGLWRAAVRRPTSYSDEPFSLSASANGLRGNLAGRLAVERQAAGRWSVVTADGRTRLAIADSGEQAKTLRHEYEAALEAAPYLAIERSGRDWRLSPGELRFASRDAALARQELLVNVGRQTKARRRLVMAATSAGFVIGLLGMISVGRRARWTPERAAAADIARTFQNLRLFRRMTALENVLVGIEARRPERYAGRRLRARKNANRLMGPWEDARQLLEFVGLAGLADRPAGELPYGDQRRLEIARALAVQPRLLLLDEPAAGMNATETNRLIELIRRIRSSGVTVVLIEHEMDLVMNMSEHVVVLDAGTKIAAGPPHLVRRDPAVIEAYLGGSA